MNFPEFLPNLIVAPKLLHGTEISVILVHEIYILIYELLAALYFKCLSPFFSNFINQINIYQVFSDLNSIHFWFWYVFWFG